MIRRDRRVLSQSDFIQNVLRDLKSLKALWSHIYLALYAALAIWAVLKHPEAVQTVITITGGVVSAVFAGYVFSRRSARTRIDDYRPPVESRSCSEEETSD